MEQFIPFEIEYNCEKDISQFINHIHFYNKNYKKENDTQETKQNKTNNDTKIKYPKKYNNKLGIKMDIIKNKIDNIWKAKKENGGKELINDISSKKKYIPKIGV